MRCTIMRQTGGFASATTLQADLVAIALPVPPANLSHRGHICPCVIHGHRALHVNQTGSMSDTLSHKPKLAPAQHLQKAEAFVFPRSGCIGVRGLGLDFCSRSGCIGFKA